MAAWQLKNEKNRFRALVKAAEKEDPRDYRPRSGKSSAALRGAPYQRLVQRKGSLLDFFQNSPWANADIDEARLFLSFLSLGKAQKGVAELEDGPRKRFYTGSNAIF